MCRRISVSKTAAANRSALALQAEASDGHSAAAVAIARAVVSEKNDPDSAAITVSRAPPISRATTGQPHAWASTAVMPKSSICGKTSSRARR